MEAEIIREYYDFRNAEAVSKAISPDNFKTPSGLYIKTTRKGNKVVTCIKCRRKLHSFIATIDDLLFCVSIAEKSIRTVKKLK